MLKNHSLNQTNMIIKIRIRINKMKVNNKF